MTDHHGINDFVDDVTGLYRASTSWPFFHEFEGEFESLCEFRMLSRFLVDHAVAELPTAVDDEIASLEAADRAGEDVVVDAVTLDYWNDRVSRVPDHFRTFVSTGIAASLFGSLEVLVDAMVSAAALEANAALEYDKQQMAVVDKQVRFLEKVCGMSAPLTREQRRHLQAIRDMRNRLVHSLGRGVSDDLKRELNRLVATAEHGEFVLDDRFVVAAMEIVAGIAASLESAFEARFGG